MANSTCKIGSVVAQGPVCLLSGLRWAGSCRKPRERQQITTPLRFVNEKGIRSLGTPGQLASHKEEGNLVSVLSFGRRQEQGVRTGAGVAERVIAPGQLGEWAGMVCCALEGGLAGLWVLEKWTGIWLKIECWSGIECCTWVLWVLFAGFLYLWNCSAPKRRHTFPIPRVTCYCSEVMII